MKSQAKTITGGCLCGAIRYQAVGNPIYVPYCYCNSCRKATGAPVTVRAVFPAKQVLFTKGDRKTYQSSPGVSRTFCPDCGTPLSWEGVWGGTTRIELHISTLDQPDAIKPDRHAFLDQSINWFSIDDTLPRHIGSSTKIELGS